MSIPPITRPICPCSAPGGPVGADCVICMDWRGSPAEDEASAVDEPVHDGS